MAHKHFCLNCHRVIEEGNFDCDDDRDHEIVPVCADCQKRISTNEAMLKAKHGRIQLVKWCIQQLDYTMKQRRPDKATLEHVRAALANVVAPPDTPLEAAAIAGWTGGIRPRRRS
jgi:hypothetical protein